MQAVVVIVKAGGTGRPRSTAITARLAALPPSEPLDLGEGQVVALVAVVDVGHVAGFSCMPSQVAPFVRALGQGATMILIAPLSGSLKVARACS